jgi:DNA mismatch repair ATPase MutS
LIAKGVRVANPVVIESPGSAIVISGSNMSGKTTYLRAVGLNALLAFAGGAVCAKEFSIRRSRVRTTVRVEDDLGAGVSLFLAEVSRIAAVVEDAGKSNEPPVLFLLDEILHGTNAADRREATQLVLRRLLGSDAWGIITTHDPQIAAVHDQVHEARVTAVHFTDAVEAREGGVAMTFDYVLRPGPATTTNALRILEKLGLRADD